MKTGLRLTLAFGLAALFLASCATPPAVGAPEANGPDPAVESLRGEKAELELALASTRERLAALEKELAELAAGKSSLSQTRFELERERDGLLVKTAGLVGRIDELELTASRMTAERDYLSRRNAELESARDGLARTLTAGKDDLKSQVASLTERSADLERRLSLAEADKGALQARLDEEARRLAEIADQLRRQLRIQIERGEVDIVQYRDVLIVHIKDSVLFLPDSAALKPEYEGVLRSVAQAFNRFPDKVVRVEGHTAVARSRWASSWDLGASRAVAVVRFFESKAGVDPARLVALSFGETRPIASNATEEGRSRNRRVELVLVDRPLYQVAELLESGK